MLIDHWANLLANVLKNERTTGDIKFAYARFEKMHSVTER